MSEWALKRFWKAAQAEPAEGGWTVTLDGRGVRTPAKAPLVLPTQALAEAIALEWQAQQDKVDPTTMPLTRTANSALDKVRLQQAEVADMLAAYGDSDLLCYRADAPDDLVQRQRDGWDPLLDWAEATYGARLHPRTGIMHDPQDADALRRLAGPVHAMDAFRLAAFHDLVSLTGSRVLGLAATERARPPQDIWDLSRIDETFQQEQWGTDEEAAEIVALKRDAFLTAERFYRMAEAPQRA